MLAAAPGFAQTPPQTPPPAQPAAQPATPPALTFPNDASILFNTVKADKTADFEAVMAKLHEALHKSDKPERKQQAASWKIFKSVDLVNGNALYLFVVDPPVKDADYTVSKILAEAFPNEAMDLYKKYTEAFASGRNLMNLQLIKNMSTAPAAAAAAKPPDQQ
jgi:hypothetical protein